MDSGTLSPLTDFVKCCDCGCSCSTITLRSVKRKYDELEGGSRFVIPGFDDFSNPRVGIDVECAALRETVRGQQIAIQDLYAELEEERNAASSAANEAMSMILRVQREKSEIQMEARQFKRFAEEKMTHDEQELLALEDLLYKREQFIHSLICEIESYKHRMLSYGVIEAEGEGVRSVLSRNPSMIESLDGQFDLPLYNYPPLKCSLNLGPYESDNDDVDADVEKYAFGETPCNRDHLKNLEYRISQMERSPSVNQLDGNCSGSTNVVEKVIECPGEFSTGSLNSGSSYKKMESVSQMEDYSNLRNLDIGSENRDDMSDRVYTIDSVHNGVPCNGSSASTEEVGVDEEYAATRVYTIDPGHNGVPCNASSAPKAEVGVNEEYVSTPRVYSLNENDNCYPDIQKLYVRLQVLEADRESMRQEIISMRTDKGHNVLLKEIAQKLCNEMAPMRPSTVKKSSLLESFSVMSIFKWVVSFLSWRKKARQSKYMLGPSTANAGLISLLDKDSRLNQWRCLSNTKVLNLAENPYR